MNLGLSSYTYTWSVGVPGSPPPVPLSAYDLIDYAASFRLPVVQIADNLPLEKLESGELKSIRSYASEKGIAIEMGGRGLTPSHTIQCLETAALLRSPILRMVIDGTGFEPSVEDVASIIRDMLPEFRAKGIALAIENHDRLKAREFENIILKVDDPLVGICLDSVNSMGAGEGFEEVSRILLPYTINLHLKDFSIRRVSHKMGIIIEGTPAGRGMLNIRELIARCSETGRCNSAILELWTPPEESIEKTIEKECKWAEESVSFLAQYF